jgi:hypothetical protein
MMYQRLGEARTKPARAHYHTRGWKLGIRIGTVYKLHTPRGFLIVQVVSMHKSLVTVREVEDTQLFRVEPLRLEAF